MERKKLGQAIAIGLAVTAPYLASVGRDSGCEGRSEIKSNVAVCEVEGGHLVTTRKGDEFFVEESWKIGMVGANSVSFWRMCPYVAHVRIIRSTGEDEIAQYYLPMSESQKGQGC